MTIQSVQLVKKENVTGSSHFERKVDPSYSQIKLSPAGGFMFSLGIRGVNLNSATKMFDVVLEQHQDRILTGYQNTTVIPLEACTMEHLNFDSAIQQHYTEFNMQEWLCPRLNSIFSVQGKQSSHIWKRLTLKVNRCDSNTTSGCAGDAAVAALQSTLGSFRVQFFVVAAQINPGSVVNYTSYYLQDRNQFDFTTTFAARASLQIHDYTINTDQSISPVEDIDPQTGIYVPQPWRYRTMPYSPNTYALIQIDKASTSATFTRVFQKVDEFFAYIGGLVGTILGFIFIMATFNQISYYMSIASKLFTYTKQNKISSDSFNILKYIGFIIYQILDFFGFCKEWQQMVKIKDIRDQTIRQLDIALLMKRIYFLEKCVMVILPQHKIDMLYAQKKETLEQLKEGRKKYQLFDQLQKNFFSSSNKVICSSDLIVQSNVHEIPSQELIESREERVYQEEMSQTSVSSFGSNRIQDLRQKAEKILNQVQQGQVESIKIVQGMDKEQFRNLLDCQRQGKHGGKERQKGEKRQKGDRQEIIRSQNEVIIHRVDIQDSYEFRD